MQNTCSIAPTQDEVKTLDLPDSQEVNRSSHVYDTSSPPPPKRRKNTDTHKTKGSKTLSKQLKPQLNQSFSMPAEEHTPPANVSSAHVSSQVSKDKSVYPDIEELKQHMEKYVRTDIYFLMLILKYKFG